MRFSDNHWIGALVTVFARVSALDAFEPANFNITEALFNNGVNVSAISKLGDLTEQSSIADCSIAVCCTFSVASTSH